MQMPNPKAKTTVSATVAISWPDRMFEACSRPKISDETTITTHSDFPASRSIFTAIPRVRISSTNPTSRPDTNVIATTPTAYEAAPVPERGPAGGR
jgi:hypothetical protein